MDFDIDNIDDLDDIENFDNDDLFELLDQINYDETTKDEDDDESQKPDKLNFCDNCNSFDNVVEDNTEGIVLCKNCGTILGDLMDKNPEWRDYGNDGKASNNRCSYTSNAFLPQSSLGTSMAGIGMNKVKILHGWSAMPYRERSLNLVLKDIQHRCRKAGILKYIEDDAKILYKNISECKHVSGENKGKNIIIRGNNRKSLIAACVFFACKRKGKTRSQKEIGKIFDLKYTHVTRGCKTFLRLIKIRKMQYDFNSSTPEHFIYRFCRSLHISKEYANQAVNITKNIQKLNIASVHTPLSVATGSILLVAELNNIPLTKKLIATKFDVSEVTITKAYRKLEGYKHIITNDELTDKLVKVIDERKSNSKVPDALKKRYDRISSRDLDEKKASVSPDELPDDDSLSDIFEKVVSSDKLDLKSEDFDKFVDASNIDIYDRLDQTDQDYKDIIDRMSD